MQAEQRTHCRLMNISLRYAEGLYYVRAYGSAAQLEFQKQIMLYQLSGYGPWAGAMVDCVRSFLQSREGIWFTVSRLIELGFLDDFIAHSGGNAVDPTSYAVKSVAYINHRSEIGKFVGT